MHNVFLSEIGKTTVLSMLGGWWNRRGGGGAIFARRLLLVVGRSISISTTTTIIYSTPRRHLRRNHCHGPLLGTLATSSTTSTSPSTSTSTSTSTASNATAGSTTTEVIVVRHGETDWNLQLRVQGVTDIPLNDKGRLQAEASAKALLIEQVLGEEEDTVKVEIYSSHLKRASDTAKAIAEGLLSSSSSSSSASNSNSNSNSNSTTNDLPRVSLTTTPALQEWKLGALEGLRKQDEPEKDTNDDGDDLLAEDWRIFSQWANPMVSWQDARQPLSAGLLSAGGASGDGGESMEQVRTRAVQCIEEAVDKQQLQAQQQQQQQQQRNLASRSVLIFVTHGGVLGQLLRHVVAGPSTRLSEEEPAAAAAAAENPITAVDSDNNIINYSRPGNACISRFAIETFTSSSRSTTLATTSKTNNQVNHGEKVWRILSWADTSHLKGDLAPIAANYADQPK
jgi:broad specificity phosphatase PhoE